MPYCPGCLTQYIEGTKLCANCRIPLVAGSSRETSRTSEIEERADVKIVRVRTFSGPTAALDRDLARNILQKEGIPCILPGQTSAQVLPVLEVPLLVREEDVERAARVLSSYFDSPGPASVR